MLKNCDIAYVLIPLTCVLLAGCSRAAPQSGRSASEKIAGKWVRADPAVGHLDLTQEGTTWRVRLTAAGKPNGMATAGDCDAEAVGSLEGDTLVARAVPFEGENQSVDQSDIDSVQPGSLTIRFSEAGADVIDSGLANFCGVGSELGGLYVRADAAF